MHDYYFLPFEFLFRSLNLDLGFVHAVAHLDPALVELLGQAVLEGLQLVKAIGHLKGTRRKKLMANYVPRKYSYTTVIQILGFSKNVRSFLNYLLLKYYCHK